MWQFKRFDGMHEEVIGRLPGNLSETEIIRVLQRLYSRELSHSEVLDASRRSNDPAYSPLLQLIGRQPALQVGENPFYTAEYITKQ